MADQKVAVIIAHEQRFMADSVAGLLEGAAFEIVAKVSKPGEIENVEVSVDPQLCIVGLYRTDFPEVCKMLRDRFPRSKIALLDTGETESLVRAARTQRLDGCFPLDLDPELVLSGLRLVEAGTRCFPQGDHVAANDQRRGEARLVQLTPREKAVLELIGEGMANKTIAHTLAIAESTVKAHLNAVLRKTGTSNRTQAARWAYENGQVA